MKKLQIVKIIDLLSFISLLLIISTGAFLKYTLPPRSGGSSVWGLTRHEWGDIHFYISILFLLLLSIHLLLHLAFIKKAIKGKTSSEQNYRLVIGVISIIILVLLSLAPLFSPVDESNTHRHGNYYHNQDN